ncbi:N-acetyltransferase B complex non catalytic subunit-domain-containing protein [Chlamydoabsidia padenii]|nr:N-acetyltransferase B complex non catalytic subunit-domain-containing protein [Chlamydoabsidia padenii]
MSLDYMTERKLRPLYDSIDDGQFKVALQHANKLLKKSPNWNLVKALKAIVLIRTGKTDEATDLCQQVKKSIPTDEPTLQAIGIAYKELGTNHSMVELYENVFNAQPKNEEFGIQWFMAMVRSNDYKGQQQAAVKLQRVFKKDKYLFWAIMSLALQGQHGNKLSYTLAERMMTKAHEEKRLVEVEHMRLFLLILMDQQKYQEALALLDTPLGETSLRDPEVCQIKVELELKNQKWDKVLASSEVSLKENSDDWINWLAYFDATFGLLEESGGVNKEIVDKAKSLVLELQQSTHNSSILKRGPFLAELELDYRLNKTQIKDEKVILDHIIAYFERFGSKSCCFEDLKTYIGFLAKDSDKSKLFIKTIQDTIKDATEKSEQIKNFYRKITVYKIERFLGLAPRNDLKTGLAYVDTLWDLYQQALPLGEGLEKTEYQYGDDFVLLASHVLYDLYLEHKKTELLVQTVTLLEAALAKSTYNFQIKLILVRLYIVLGVSSRALAIYKTMDIKQIQFDTMLHYFTDRLVSLGCVNELESHLYESMMIYKSNDVETPDMQVQAYKFGTFSKIQEFIEFRSRLDNSMQHSISRLELLRIDALNSSFQAKYAVQHFQELDVPMLKLDDDYINSRSDNRDFKVMMNCNPSSQVPAQELIKPAKSTNSTWLHLFSFIMQILNAACDTKGTKDLSGFVQNYSNFMQRDGLKEKITAEEYWLASYVHNLAMALVLIRDPSTRSSESKKAVEHLKKAVSILDSHANLPIDQELESWNGFHNVSIVLEAFNYGSVLLEIISRTTGLTSKEAKRKAADNANGDELVHTVMMNYAASKKSLVQLQVVCRKGQDNFKPSLQKKLIKEITTSYIGLTAFKSKVNQNALGDTVKQIVSSWNHSIAYLGDEVDRRILKLQ